MRLPNTDNQIIDHVVSDCFLRACSQDTITTSEQLLLKTAYQLDHNPLMYIYLINSVIFMLLLERIIRYRKDEYVQTIHAIDHRRGLS